jgi:hypothetical protein
MPKQGQGQAMAETDHPLKRLVQTAAPDFASWLLGEEVQEIETVNVESSFRAEAAPGRCAGAC